MTMTCLTRFLRGSRLKSRALPACASLVALLVGAGAASAEGLKPIEYTFPDGTVVRLSGQVNMGVLGYDDGQHTYDDFVDNDNSSTRARIQLFSNPNYDWKFEANFEVEYQPLASNVVSQFDDQRDWNLDQADIRKAEAAISNKTYGKLWLGQGSMASDGTAEVDKSGTTVVAYASVSDTAGGYFFRAPDGVLSDVTVGDAFNDYDGLSRKFRIRYDTPTFGGFGVQVSYGYDWLVSDPKPMYDIAATYSGTLGDFAVASAVGLSRNDQNESTRFDGSFSALHKPSGISVTFAAGEQDDTGPTGYYGYAKLGYEHAFFDVGSTAFSIDYYLGSDVANADSDSRSIGIAAVQNIDAANLKLWLLWRTYSYDEASVSFDKGQAIFGGALVKF